MSLSMFRRHMSQSKSDSVSELQPMLPSDEMVRNRFHPHRDRTYLKWILIAVGTLAVLSVIFAVRQSQPKPSGIYGRKFDNEPRPDTDGEGDFERTRFHGAHNVDGEPAPPTEPAEDPGESLDQGAGVVPADGQEESLNQAAEPGFQDQGGEIVRDAVVDDDQNDDSLPSGNNDYVGEMRKQDIEFHEEEQDNSEIYNPVHSVRIPKMRVASLAHLERDWQDPKNRIDEQLNLDGEPEDAGGKDSNINDGEEVIVMVTKDDNEDDKDDGDREQNYQADDEADDDDKNNDDDDADQENDQEAAGAGSEPLRKVVEEVIEQVLQEDESQRFVPTEEYQVARGPDGADEPDIRAVEKKFGLAGRWAHRSLQDEEVDYRRENSKNENQDQEVDQQDGQDQMQREVVQRENSADENRNAEGNENNNQEDSVRNEGNPPKAPNEQIEGQNEQDQPINDGQEVMEVDGRRVQVYTDPITGQAKIDAVIKSINATCAQKGGIYAEYQCQVVSWGDATRGVLDGQLSVVGPNITDCRLYAKSGERLFTVRKENWNEQLGKVSSDQIAVRVGNHKPGISQTELETVSLGHFLKNIGKYGQYAGLSPGTNLSSPTLDEEISIRFQTTFLPVESGKNAAVEFVSETYNHNTFNDNDPKNLLLLCTTQGTAIQQDGDGCKKLFHHSLDYGGRVHRHWLEAEVTRHQVGGPQKETKEEKDDALARGKATSELIGTESLGSRFNVLMTIQIPLQQINPSTPLTVEEIESICRALGTTPDEQTQMFARYGPPASKAVPTTKTLCEYCPTSRSESKQKSENGSKAGRAKSWFKRGSRKSDYEKSAPDDRTGSHRLERKEISKSGRAKSCFRNRREEAEVCSARRPALNCQALQESRSRFQICLDSLQEYTVHASLPSLPIRRESEEINFHKPQVAPLKVNGRSFAARVSRGTEEDIWEGLTLLLPKRSETEHITVTVVIYNVVAGGLPSADDVIKAVDDMENLYASCSWTGRLAEDGASFFRAEISPMEALRIAMPVKP